MKEVKKEVEEGKYLEIPPKKKGGLKIILPTSVIKQLTEISNKLNDL
jgi:hypothetical protein